MRKTVTALFGDLVGSTSFGEQVDAEAARRTMAKFYELVRGAIEELDGTVVKFMGDGVMALFGHPEASEDDALRAVLAARVLQDRFTAFSDEVRARHGVELGFRVGVNTGELVIGEDDDDMVGDVLNTAARLEAACEPGHVLVGEDTWRLTRTAMTYEALGRVVVKGKADGVSTFRLEEVIEQEHVASTPFVGRVDELDVLKGVFAQVEEARTPQLASAIGAPGVGKTRLAREFEESVEARAFTLRLERNGGSTFRPIAELMRASMGSVSDESINALVAGHPESRRLASVLTSFVGRDQARSTEESFWAVRQLIELLAAEEPVLLVVDDIQWAETLFWELVDHLTEWVKAPLMILALARPELRELRPDLCRVGRRVAASVSLEGLDSATTRELAERLLGSDNLPQDLIDRLPESTQGNPLFTRELVEMMVADGILAKNENGWHLTIDAEAIVVPPTILSLLASRVERLPAGERQLVELASVIGTEFDRGTLSDLADPRLGSRIGDLIESLRRQDLLEPSGWAGDSPLFRFHHVLIRDAAYRRLLKGRRAELHHQVGRSIAKRDDHNVAIAHHFAEAYAYRDQLNEIDDEAVRLGSDAVRRFRAAAEASLAREDFSAAVTYAKRGLAIDVGEVSEHDEMLLIACEAHLSAGDVPAGTEFVQRLNNREGDQRLEAWAECFTAQLWMLTDAERLVDADVLAADAVPRLEKLGDKAGVAKAHVVRALILARLGRTGDCEAELDAALAAARRAQDWRRTSAVLRAMPSAAIWGPSSLAQGRARCLDVLRLLRVTKDSMMVEAAAVRCLGALEGLGGSLGEAREKLEQSRTMSQAMGLRHGSYETELFAGLVELHAGEPRRAEGHLRVAHEGLTELGIGAEAGHAGALLARALLLLNKVDEAETFAQEALSSAGQYLQAAIWGRIALAEIRAAAGELAVAEQLVGEAIEIAEGTDLVLDYVTALDTGAQVAEMSGLPELAEQRSRAAAKLRVIKGMFATDQTPNTVPPSPEPSRADSADAISDFGASSKAWDLLQRLIVAHEANDREAFTALHAHDFVVDWHNPLRSVDDWSGKLDLYVDTLFAMVPPEQVKIIPELLALRGESVCVFRLSFGGESRGQRTIALFQERDGLIGRADWFSGGQLNEAQDELERQWVELGGHELWATSSVLFRWGMSSNDRSMLRRLLSDDFVAIDNRSSDAVPLSADKFSSSNTPWLADDGVRVGVGASSGGIVVIAENLRQSDDTTLHSVRFVRGEDEVATLVISHVGQALLTRLEVFRVEDRALADSHYDQLSGKSDAWGLAQS